MIEFDPYTTDLLVLVGIAGIVALGMQIAIASRQLLSAQAAFMGLSGYAAAISAVNFHLPILVASAVGIITSAVTGLIVGTAISRLQSWFLALATIGFGQTVVVLLNNADVLGGAAGFPNIPIVVTLPMVYGVLLVEIYFCARFQNSRLAFSHRAIAEDQLAAAASGINVTRTRIQAFTLATTMAGLGGPLFVFYNGYIRPANMDFLPSLNFVIYVALGGQGTWLGGLFGSGVLVLLPEFLRFSNTQLFLIYGVVLVVMTIFRPGGLLVRKPVGTPLADALLDDQAVRASIRGGRWLARNWARFTRGRVERS